MELFRHSYHFFKILDHALLLTSLMQFENEHVIFESLGLSLAMLGLLAMQPNIAVVL